ncbi:sulfite exporter TauE/SafE family protein [Naasia sp. SYSU D00948]|uniref:sulfite exporter TauE/SafE family protein n=1 Tax=Naasia sp. SYSU D00948 TaxID=2817379 RepID=UPI001B30A613|nr:sulfite exporter TauE/SafE family protein [Naasia sp. SYSU D00948]
MTTTAPARTPWLALIGVGVIGGFLSGLFGVGGGVVMVPLLVALARFDQRRASALSLAAIIPAGIVGASGYLVNGQVNLPAAIALAAGAIPGALLGARLLRRIHLGLLRWMFIALLLLVALRMVLVVPERGAEIELEWWLLVILAGIGLLVGIASGLFGVGGGIIIVPVLVAGFGIGDLLAKGTSLTVIIASSAMGTVTNVRGGLVRLREALVVGVAASLLSLAGVACAFLLSPEVSAIAFAALLLLSAAQLAIRSLRGQGGRRRRKRGTTVSE